MRRIALLPLVLAFAAAPAASACTLENCVEVHLAHGATGTAGQHALTADCLVAGRAGVRFTVTGTAVATGHDVARTITLRCTAYTGSTVVFDSTAPNAGPAATLSGGFLSSANVRVCVTASATWADGHSVTVTDCS